MRELKNLVQIVSDRSRKNLPLLDVKAEDPGSSKELELYHMIRQLRDPSDSDAANTMYAASADDPRYKMLKHRLKNKLLNHLFFIDFNESGLSPCFYLKQEAETQLHFSRILMTLEEHDLVEKICNKALSKTLDAHYTETSIGLISILREIDAISGKKNDFSKQVKLLEKCHKIFKLESQAENLYQKVLLEVKKSLNSRKNVLPDLNKKIEKLADLEKACKSPRIQTLRIYLTFKKHELDGDHRGLISLAQKVEKQYSAGIIKPYWLDIQEIQCKQLRSYVQLRSPKKGIQYALKAPKYVQYSRNWKNFHEALSLLYIQNRQLGEALEVIKKVVRSHSSGTLDEESENRWQLYQAYLYLMKPDKRLQKSFIKRCC